MTGRIPTAPCVPPPNVAMPDNLPTQVGQKVQAPRATMADIEGRDYYLFLDISSSMMEADVEMAPGLIMSRWDAIKEAIPMISQEILKRDPDGFTMYTFAKFWDRYDITDMTTVQAILKETEPCGIATLLYKPLNDAIEDFFKNRRQSKGIKGATIIIITDGAAFDKAALVERIQSAAAQLQDRRELGISFIQVGKDQGATSFLRFMDDQIQARHDIVDCKTIDDVERIGIKQILLDALRD